MLIEPRRITIVQGAEAYMLNADVRRFSVDPFFFSSMDYRNRIAELIIEETQIRQGDIGLTMGLEVTKVKNETVSWKALELREEVTHDQRFVSCYEGLRSQYDKARESQSDQVATVVRLTVTGSIPEMGEEGDEEQDADFVDLPVVVGTPSHTEQDDSGMGDVGVNEKHFTFIDVNVVIEDEIEHAGIVYEVFEMVTYPEDATLRTAKARTK